MSVYLCLFTLYRLYDICLFVSLLACLCVCLYACLLFSLVDSQLLDMPSFLEETVLKANFQPSMKTLMCKLVLTRVHAILNF
jgi:hypothetical protein